jgi:glycosyltransferase involved in cell wall biosynthesis
MTMRHSQAHLDVHAIILTLNEEQHISRCISSIKSLCQSITVVDSGSTDRTVELAQELGAEVFISRWINYASQLNVGIERLAGKGGWLLRIDADEVLESSGPVKIRRLLAEIDESVSGIAIQRRIHFLGKRMRHGATEPSWQLRLWRNGKGSCEQRWMDEHIKVSGTVFRTKTVVSDVNQNSLTWWIAKHNSYASREAIDILNVSYGFLPKDSLFDSGASGQARVKRLLKEKLYLRLPSGVRSFGYFFYRYFLRCGFLDGKAGFYWHSLQGLWYRNLVDAKVFEIKKHATDSGCSIVEAIRAKTGIDPVPHQTVVDP